MSEPKVVKEFTLLEVVLVEARPDGKQHFVTKQFALNYDMTTAAELESIPWSEVIGRRITSVSREDGLLCIGLEVR